MPNDDLTVDTFLVLRKIFFDEEGNPKPFPLRDKMNTQDDPLDEYIAEQLKTELVGSKCQKSPGPLISPDLVIFKSTLFDNQGEIFSFEKTSDIVGIEVKKLQRQKNGSVARSSGMDYNTTPPCGTIRIYDPNDNEIKIRGFYLFVCQEETSDGEYIITALSLCDGNILNEDFELYLTITSQRLKELGLGTYGDGANRNRPMLIFSNPLGSDKLDGKSTIILSNKIENCSELKLIYEIMRKTKEGENREFFVYQKSGDVNPSWKIEKLIEPFPKPSKRVIKTQSRGKFKIVD